MARPLRIEYEGAFYHVTARGNERKKIFFSNGDYQKFRQYLLDARKKYGIVLHAYVMMTNHYHLLIETPQANLSRVMHFVNGSYTTYTNRKRERNGHLFQGRYKGIVVDKDCYLLELSRYLHLNPVRAGMVKRPEEYAYSSYRSYISAQPGEIVSRDMILGMLSERKYQARRIYASFVESSIDSKQESPLESTYAGAILGSEGFVRNTLIRITDNDRKRKEVSYRDELKSVWTIDQLLDVVCQHYTVSRQNILESRSIEPRKMAVYLVNKFSGATNTEVGAFFGHLSYSGVSKLCRRFSEQLKKDPGLKRRFAEIEKTLSNVKG